jgi:heat shock protein HslJ
MSVDVVDQLRRLVESFDEFVDDVTTDEVVQRVGGSAHPAPSALDRDDRSGWRRFSLVAAAVLLVGGLVAALVWVNADRSSPSSSTSPPVTQDSTGMEFLGTWVVTRRQQNVDDAGSQMFVPLASPLPTYRFEPDGTVSGFDGCNSSVAPWSFNEGEFTTSELTNATAAVSTISCEDSDGNPLPTIGPSPERLELIDGAITMVFDGEDGMTAHAQRLSDLPTPRGLAGSSWILAVDGPDIAVNFGRDGTVEFRDDTVTCAAGSYTYDPGVLVLDLDATPHGCPDARLDELTPSPLEVASFSDNYMADTILLVPATGGAVRLFPESASTEDTAGGDSGDTIPAG